MINSPISKYCVCHRFGVQYTTDVLATVPNEATNSVSTQVAIMDVPKHEDEEEELEEEPEREL